MKIDKEISFLEENINNDKDQHIINLIILKILKQMIKMIYRLSNPNF